MSEDGNRVSSARTTKPKEIPTLDLLHPQTSTKFNRTLSLFKTLHLDFPRLISLTSIKDKTTGNELWKRCDPDVPLNMEQVLQFFVAMCHAVGIDSEVISSKFFEYFTRDNTIVKTEFPFELLKFLTEVITDGSPLAGILKLVNQDIIVPAVSVLRYLFYTAEINYFEIRGKWKVSIDSYNDKLVVTTKRWERSSPEGFNFKWEVAYMMNKQGTELMSTNLSITKIDYTIQGVSDEQKEQLLELLKDLYRPKV